MRKIILLFVFLLLIIGNVEAKGCNYYSDQMSVLKDKMDDNEYERNNLFSNIKSRYPSLPYSTQYSAYVKENDELVNDYNNWVLKYNDNREKYLECYDEFENFFNKGYDYFKIGNYLKAIEYYKKADDKISNNEAVITNLGLSYYYLAEGYTNKEEYNKSIKYYKLADNYEYKDKAKLYAGMGITYFSLEDYKSSKKYLNKALDITFDKERYSTLKSILEQIEKFEKEEKEYKEAKKNAATNDTYSYKQYYLNELNIPKAQKSFSTNKKVIVAVIDDGVNINHPDITNNIWVNKKEVPGNGKDDDNNGYIDDYNGWNFVYDNNNVLPLGEHGTMVAGIIGAERNNKEGISGIAKFVKIMPVGVCGLESCSETDVVNGIKYAVDNGANIINLSLGGSQFKGYNIEYDEALKYAYSKGVIVVIAAGNGDKLSYDGVNTDVNNISPVCNYGNNYKNIIGVGSHSKDGYRTNWTNYGKCVDFLVFGEGITSLSVPLYSEGNKYYESSGTSFSAPILSGIIALGYNKYGKLSNHDVYDYLNKSLVKNKVGNSQIDADKYLENIGTGIKQKENDSYMNEIKPKIEKTFSRIKNKYKGKTEEERKIIFEGILKTINNRKEKIKDEKTLLIFEYFIELINAEINGGCDEFSKLIGLCE